MKRIIPMTIEEYYYRTMGKANELIKKRERKWIAKNIMRARGRLCGKAAAKAKRVCAIALVALTLASIGFAQVKPAPARPRCGAVCKVKKAALFMPRLAASAFLLCFVDRKGRPR